MRGDITDPDISNQSLAQSFKEVVNSTKSLIQSEMELVTAEVKQSAKTAGSHVTQLMTFGFLLALSVFPLLAFFVIGLGELMGGRYWLSSLIVAVLCAAIGGSMAYRAYKKLVEHDLQIPVTRASLRRESAVAQGASEELKDAAKGERYGSNSAHQYT
jgi:hypothetical protein